MGGSTTTFWPGQIGFFQARSLLFDKNAMTMPPTVLRYHCKKDNQCHLMGGSTTTFWPGQIGFFQARSLLFDKNAMTMPSTVLRYHCKMLGGTVKK
jgi:hypothetical protein